MLYYDNIFVATGIFETGKKNFRKEDIQNEGKIQTVYLSL